MEPGQSVSGAQDRGLRAGWVVWSLLGLCLLASAFALRYGASAVAEPAPAYELVALPVGLDTLTSLTDAVGRIESCDADRSPDTSTDTSADRPVACPGVVFFWSPRMPLSRSAIPNVEQASRRLGADLTLVGFEDLERYAESGVIEGIEPELVESILAAGALTHAPSLVVHAQGRLMGPAILGYKEAHGYEAMIGARLSGEAASAAGPDVKSLLDRSVPAPPRPVSLTDYRAVGVPGAYFRWVPGRETLAYESGGRIYLMELTAGETWVGPGFVDFVPTPDGRYFVTPGPRNVGLVFYDADVVLEGARQGRAGAVRPIYVDERMRDQYPSVGIVAQDESSVRYRVMTSWFEGLLYADYEVTHGDGNAPATVRPLAAPIVPCTGMSLSTPIMSQDGSEVAVRDEASGTTKIFRILPEGRCEEVLNLGMPTRKVAWHASGRKLAFSTPRVRSARTGGAEPGIFVYDRDERRVTRVTDSEGASQLAFPDFIGDDAVVFMVPGRTSGEQSIFRVVEPLP